MIDANGTQPAVMVVAEEVRSQEALRRALGEAFEVVAASCAEEAEKLLERRQPQVLLCDQRMPGTTGVAFLRQVRSRWPDVVRIIISGHADAADIIGGVDDAGIYHCILKPWQPEPLLLTVRNAAELHRLHRENQRLDLERRAAESRVRSRVEARPDQITRSFDIDRLVRGPGSPLNEVCRTAAKVAPYDISVLVTGESGTGKELLARAIHYRSNRAGNAFVVENCGALPDDLLESELFGHRRGSFTGAYEDRIGLFQQADGGTIFLDEIGETSPAFQVKLLRALQEGEIRPVGSSRSLSVDVRVLAATNRDLEEDVGSGRFREDLYYRLATFTLHVPPLRERPMDIPLIATGLLERASGSLRKPADGFTDEAMECLRAYRWPGNVRELQNEVYRMLALAPGPLLGAELLSRRVLRAAGEDDEPALRLLTTTEGPLRARLETLEAQLLRETLIRHRWNKTRAASELGLSRVGLRSKLNRYGLERKSGV